MTDTTQSTATLRALLPRLFSRAQPVGGFEQLVRTVRAQPHDRCQVAIIPCAAAHPG